MVELLELIRTNVNASFKRVDGDRYFFGTLKKHSSSEEKGESAIMIATEDIITGYVIRSTSRPFHEASYTGEEEGLIFKIFPDSLILTINQYDILKDKDRHPQAIFKDDWVGRDNYSIKLPGNYSEHRTIIEETIDRFDRSGECELWLPDFFKASSSLS